MRFLLAITILACMTVLPAFAAQKSSFQRACWTDKNPKNSADVVTRCVQKDGQTRVYWGRKAIGAKQFIINAKFAFPARFTMGKGKGAKPTQASPALVTAMKLEIDCGKMTAQPLKVDYLSDNPWDDAAEQAKLSQAVLNKPSPLEEPEVVAMCKGK